VGNKCVVVNKSGCARKMAKNNEKVVCQLALESSDYVSSSSARINAIDSMAHVGCIIVYLNNSYREGYNGQPTKDSIKDPNSNESATEFALCSLRKPLVCRDRI